MTIKSSLGEMSISFLAPTGQIEVGLLGYMYPAPFPPSYQQHLQHVKVHGARAVNVRYDSAVQGRYCVIVLPPLSLMTVLLPWVIHGRDFFVFWL